MQPSKCCIECGSELTAPPSGSVVNRLYCERCARDDEHALAQSLWATVGFSLVAVIVACFIAFVFAPPSVRAAETGIPRYGLAKMIRGYVLLVDFVDVPQSERECQGFANKRNAAYTYAGVQARWVCVDLMTIGDKRA